MSLMRFMLIVVSIVFMIVILRLVKNKRLSMKYSFLWLELILAIFVCAVFPIIPYRVSALIGFETPANFIFLVAIFFLLAISLSLSIIVSQQSRKITTLVQSLALLENLTKHDIKHLEESSDENSKEKSTL